MLAVYLDGRHRTIGVHVVSIGTADQAPVHPREFFAPALHLCASAVIAAHNHPSGDATPSSSDRLITERLKQAGELLGIECLDHVVIGGDRFYSFADERFHPIPDTE
jgi:DNA repair protein RadC